jgi:Outer membrane protein beta-barrel family
MKLKTRLMRKLLSTAILLIFILPNGLLGQSTITGQIKDQNNKVVELIEVQLQNKDSLFEKSDLTNAEGKFSITAEKGQYKLIVKQLGKVLYKQNIIVTTPPSGAGGLGVITITQNPLQLKEVVVTNRKKLIERKIDRLVFNVENSIAATGGDAVDALKVTPKLQVDDDGISIIGKGSVMVMIDDRLMKLSGDDLMNFLKTIPADNIKVIEVITTPPAKYDADGTGGLVNIKLKKVKKDDLFKASVNSSYEQRTYPTGSLGGNVVSQVKKFSIYSNINYKNGSMKTDETRQYYYPSQLWEQKNNRREYTNILSGRLGIDYKQDNKNEYGILYLGSSNKPTNNEVDNTAIYDNQNQLTNFYTKTTANRVKEDIFHSINGHYKRTIDTLGKSITANFDYLVTNQETNRNFNTNSIVNGNYNALNAYTNGNQNIKITTSNVDVELPYSKIKYTFGGKISFINTNNDFKYFDISTGQNILDNNQSNEFNYTENTQAAYFSVGGKVKKWELEFDLRGENTQTKGYSKSLNQTNTNDYFKLFPTIYIVYNANDKNVFSLEATRRIGRPSYFMSNPFKNYTSIYIYSVGNPFIQPEFNNAIELSHTYDDNLNTTLSFGYLEDGKSQIQILDPTNNISKSSFYNFFKAYRYSFDIEYTIKNWKWLESMNSVNANYRKTVANELLNNQIVEQSNYVLSSNNTITLNKSKTFFSSIELLYKSSQAINITHIDEVFITHLGFKYLVLNKNLQLTLNVYDVFKSSANKWSSYSNNVLYKFNGYYDNQFVRITALYKFGNYKINVKEKKRGNETESGRTN